MTKQPKPTRSTSASHNSSAGNDTNAIYEISFRYKQWGRRYLKAKSPAEAREKAQRIPAETGLWRDWPDSYDVEEILVVSRDEIPKDAAFVLED